tara:strand:+ start:73 stop:324 length:252 start_codon:yes stop_codon:yes gene_type:complete
MNEFVNLNSALLLILFFIVVLVISIFKNFKSKKVILVILMITVAIAGSYDSLKTDSSRIATLNELNVAVEEKKPILLYLYSDN